MYGPGRALFTASQTGLLAFNSSNDRLELRWVSRDGRPTGTVATAALRVRISPDGRRALFDRVAADTGAIDVYSIDLARGAEEPLTSSPYPEGPGAWLPDGRSVFMMIARGGPPRIVRKDFTSGVEEPVLPPAGLQEAEDVTADGQYLVYSERTSGQYDIWALPLAGTPKRVPVVVGPFSEFEARVSRDGQQVAYVSLESGQSEVYVTPFLRTGARTLVSVGGGRRPRWSRDGRSLYYISGEQELIHVPVTTAPSFQMGAHVKAFPSPVGSWTNYDIAPDGRFLALVAESLAGTQPWTMWTHWPDAIARR
jgi:Tol biopolymer transport system component